jgi:hypothetical protein
MTGPYTAGLFPYEIGLGGLIVAAASFFLGREFGRAAMLPRPRPTLPVSRVEPIPSSAISRQAPVNPIRRLDELEVLRDLGILTGEEFETEKQKLRTLWTVSSSG